MGRVRRVRVVRRDVSKPHQIVLTAPESRHVHVGCNCGASFGIAADVKEAWELYDGGRHVSNGVPFVPGDRGEWEWVYVDSTW